MLKLNSDYLKKFKQAFHLSQKIHLGINYQVLLVLWVYHPQEGLKSDHSYQRCPWRGVFKRTMNLISNPKCKWVTGHHKEDQLPEG